MGALSHHDQAMMAAGFIGAYGFTAWVYMTAILSGVFDRPPRDMLGEHASRRRIVAYIIGNAIYLVLPIFMLIAIDQSILDLWNGAFEWRKIIITGWIAWGACMLYIAFPAYSAFTLFWIVRHRRRKSLYKV